MSSPLDHIREQYEILAKIKEGGMGEIFKVRHKLLDEVRIVKTLRAQLDDSAELHERFAREARAAIRLRHPNIVQIFDFALDPSGAGMIVMEYIRGIDLQQLLALGRPPSIALTLEIAHQSLRALGYLHRHGFVHRDVSPDNLMLTRDVEGRPLVKIIDLGIAKRRDSERELTMSGMFLGKFRYASPEHFGAGGTEAVDERSDLYTFGLVLYELLTGHYPIRGQENAQLIGGHLFEPPHAFADTDPEARVPEPLRAAVLRLLAKKPEERFADAAAVVAELDALRAAHPVTEAVVTEARALIEQRPPPPGAATRKRSDVDPLVKKRDSQVRQAGLAYEAGRFGEAAGHLRAALELDPKNSWLRERLERAEREAEREAQAARQRAEREKREARRRAELDARVAGHLRAAREAREARDFLKARLLVAKALELRPGDAAIRAFAEALDREDRRSELKPSPLETAPHSGKLMQALIEIEKLRKAGRLLEAWRRTGEVIAEHGDLEPLRDLRQQIADQLLEDDE